MKRLTRWSIRILVLACLAASLADFHLPVGLRSRTWIFFEDRSGSIRDNRTHPVDDKAVHAAMEEMLEFLDETDEAGLIRYGETAEVAVPVGPITDFRIPSGHRELGTGSSPLSAARLALGSPTPPDSDITWIFFTDGQQSHQLSQLAPQLRERNIRIRIIPSGNTESPDILIEPDRSVQKLKPGNTTPLTGVLTGSGTGLVTVRASSGNVSIEWTVRKPLSGSVQFESPPLAIPADAGVVRLEIAPDPDQDAYTANNTVTVGLNRDGQARTALIIGNSDPFARPMPGWSHRIAKFLPDPIDADLVILNDLPIEAVRSSDLARLREAIRRGEIGLLVLGGPRSLSAGDYANSRLEEILPIWASPPEDIAVITLLDGSGSMEEPALRDRTKYEVALDALAQAALHLRNDRDDFGLKLFQGSPIELRELSPFRPDAEALEKARKVRLQGGTRILGAIRQSIDELKTSPRNRREILVLTDGDIADEASAFAELQAEASQADIGFTWILTGTPSDPEWKKLLVSRPQFRVVPLEAWADVPEAMADAFQNLVPAIAERGDYAIQDVRPISIQVPNIAVYLRSGLKPEAQLWWKDRDNDDVLYAVRPLGLGRVGCFTSNPGRAWTPDWTGNPAAGRAWSEVFTHLAPDGDARFYWTRPNDHSAVAEWLSTESAPTEMIAHQGHGQFVGTPVSPTAWRFSGLAAGDVESIRWSSPDGSTGQWTPPITRKSEYSRRGSEDQRVLIQTGLASFLDSMDAMRETARTHNAPLPIRNYLLFVALAGFLIDLLLGVLWPGSTRSNA